MPKPRLSSVKVADLALDLHNYRTVQQKNEIAAVQAMIVARGDWLWALTQSLLADGYLPTESIIVMEAGAPVVKTVREGNRRIAMLKLIHGLLPLAKFDIPEDIKQQIMAVSLDWKSENETVPCTIYGRADEATVDRIVRLAHGKGEKAGRDQWNTVARARHNRDKNRVSEPALDLLEHYLKSGTNATDDQKTRWGVTFPLSVLDEAMKKIAPRLGLSNAPAFAAAYPKKVQNRAAIESLILDIGLDLLGFPQIRSSKEDFAAAYGIPPIPQSSSGVSGAASGSGAAGNPTSNASGSARTTGGAGKKSAAKASTDPKSVRPLLKKFAPKGANRMKVVDLKLELERLDLARTPLAFSFVLRSMFEISAKAYCSDHKAAGLSTTDDKGNDRKLEAVLESVMNHMTTLPTGKTDLAMSKRLQGAKVELGKKNGLLSVTSLNQLIHNPNFHIRPADVASRFHNVFPFLEAMNE